MSNLRRLARKLGVKRTDDPDGVIATLQVARRLVKDHGYLPVEAVGRASAEFAAPVDDARAFWAAHYALTMAGLRKGLGVVELNHAEIDALLPIFDDAIKAQGEFNLKGRKK